MTERVRIVGPRRARPDDAVPAQNVRQVPKVPDGAGDAQGVTGGPTEPSPAEADEE